MPDLIEKYPYEPLIRYLEFLMGVSKYTAHQYSEAAKYFTAFSRKYPDFRFFETQVAIGRSYLGMGEIDKAVAVVDSALTVDPSLKDVPDIMKIKAEALYGKQGYHKWLGAREKGIDIFAKETPKIKKETDTADPINLKLESAKSEYVLKEPVKFKITFTNVSETEQRLWGIDYFDMNMEHIWIEVISPEGKKELRRHYWITEDKLIFGINNYPGEPLESGDSLVTYLYPNASSLQGDVTREEERKNRENRLMTFPKPGVYQIRAVYKEVPERYLKLYSKEGGLWSNRISVRFVEPTPEQKEILDAYWVNWVGISRGDDMLGIYDIKPLEAVIEKYPDHPFIRYARFALGWGRFCSVKKDYEGAIDIFTQLKAEYPDFRFHEVCTGLASNYLAKGEREKAIKIVNEALSADSSLKDVFCLMNIKIKALDIKYRDWLSARREGRDIFNKKTPVIEENK
jgi:tetratricopeptide (TPR) repeat protein